MTDPTRRDALKALAAAPLALTAGGAAAPVVASRTPTQTPLDPLALAEITARAVADRPLRLYAVTRPGENPVRPHFSALDGHDMKRLANLPYAARMLAGAKEVVQIIDHPFLDALADTDHLPPRGQLIHMTATSLILADQAYWWPYLNSRGTPRQFFPLPAHMVSPVWSSESMLPGAYTFGGSTYSKDELIRFRRPSVVPPADVARLKVETQPIEDVARENGIPLALLRPEASTRQAVEAATAQHQRYAVEPLCRLIAGTLTRWTHRQPMAESRGWDRLFWAFDMV